MAGEQRGIRTRGHGSGQSNHFEIVWGRDIETEINLPGGKESRIGETPYLRAVDEHRNLAGDAGDRQIDRISRIRRQRKYPPACALRTTRPIVHLDRLLPYPNVEPLQPVPPVATRVQRPNQCEECSRVRRA